MPERPAWVFDDFELDLAAWRLSRAGQTLPLEPKALALLALLIDRQGDVVTKSEILDEVWKDATVTENAMVRVVGQVRSALGDDSKVPKYIETVHTRGYRFVAPVRRAHPPARDSTGAGAAISPPEPMPEGSTEASPIAGAGLDARMAGGRPLGRRSARNALVGAVVLLLAGAASFYALNAGRPADPSPGSGDVGAATTASIAILPLDNIGPPAHQYFADGMTEALTTQLAKIEALKVISRSAVMRYRGDRPAPPAIARELDVANLVEGSALLTEDRVRITARLVEGATGRTVWNESYEGDLRDVLALQARVAREIAREIRVRMTSEEENRLSFSRAVNPAAYQEYLQGLYQYERALAVDASMFSHLREALERFGAAAALEPTWGEAHGGLAQTHLRLAGMADNHAERLRQYERARTIAEHALELDPGVVSARITLARAGFFLDGDWEATERHYREVLRLEPNNADWQYGIFLTYTGRFEEALARLRYALERWPTGSFVRYQIGLSCVCARRYDEATAEAKELRERLGDEVHATLLDGMVLIGRAQYAKAADLLDARRDALMINRATTFLQHLTYAAAKAGQQRRAREAHRELEALGGRTTASIALALDGPAAAIRTVEAAYSRRDYILLQARCWLEYENLRRVPRVAEILREVGISDPF